MMTVSKLSKLVRKVLKTVIQDPGYETDVFMLIPAPEVMNRQQLSIEDTGQSPPQQITIKIVVVGYKEKEKETDIGDNPHGPLEFIRIEDGSEPDEQQVKEGREILWNGNKFIVKEVLPYLFGDYIVGKECKAERVR
jgi:hypothetical protein